MAEGRNDFSHLEPFETTGKARGAEGPGTRAGEPVSTGPAASAPELCFKTAVELVELVHRREVSVREVVTAHLEQIERVNPTVNAICTLVAELAVEQANQVDEKLARGLSPGILSGLPIAIKDLVDTKGIRTTYGSPIYRERVPDQDVLYVERLKEAGAVVIGKSNVPEFGTGSQTFNPVFGVTRNP